MALRIIDMARDPEVDLGGLTTLISKDPALTAKILRVANSPLFGQPRRTHDLTKAVIMLGLNTTITLALSFSLTTSLKSSTASRHELERFWRRCLLSALACRELGQQCRAGAPDELFLAGLLREIGILVLAAAYPRQYPSLLADAPDHDALIARECEHLDTDHGEAGAWIMRQWGLPEYLPEVTTGSHADGPGRRSAERRDFTACVAVSGTIAEIYLGDNPEHATAHAAATSDRWLALDRELLSTVLSQVAASLPEIEELFDTPMLSPDQVNALTEEAREMLMIRNLQLLQQASEARQQARELERITAELRETARRDPLTGIANRRYFDERLARAFEAADRDERALSVGFVDLDYFKVINDRHGHQAGDRILAEVAAAIAAHLRGDDLIARYGGEEFVVLLPRAGLEVARGIMERLRALIEASEYTVTPGHSVRVTLSAGAAAHRDGATSYSAPEELLRAADRALYRAKQQGRNRVAVAD